MAGASARSLTLRSRFPIDPREREDRVTHDDVLTGYRRRLFTLAQEMGVRPACRAMGVHHSTYYRLKRQVDRWGLEALNVRERRRPRMPNQIGPHLEQRVIAFALGATRLRAAAELGRAAAGEWGGIRISEHGVWRVPQRYNLNARAKRLALVARHADPYEERTPASRRRSATSRPPSPGEKVQLDCFLVGRLSGSKGTVWQYTAADVASGFIWAELHSSERNPRARWTAELVHRVARELRAAGWKLKEVTTDNGSEFALEGVRRHCEATGARQWRIKAGRPNSTAASSAPS